MIKLDAKIPEGSLAESDAWTESQKIHPRDQNIG